jgi:hypothetical protein
MPTPSIQDVSPLSGTSATTPTLRPLSALGTRAVIQPTCRLLERDSPDLCEMGPVHPALSLLHPGSIPFALITPAAAGDSRYWIKAFPPSGSLAFAPIPAKKTKSVVFCNSAGSGPTRSTPG